MNTQSFTISPIPDDIFAKMQGKSFKDNCTVPREDLRYLKVLHVGFDGKTHIGELVVNRLIADDVLDIFKQLYEAGYEIEKIRLIDKYDADDEKSMRDNNSSAFNFRYISYSTKLSKHALGLAVDINTLYNPYVKYVDGRRNVEPANAEKYTDRSIEFPHKIDHDDLCYKVFAEHGFERAATGNMQKITSILRCQMSGLRKVRAEKCNATQKFVYKSVVKYIFTSIKMLTISS